MESFLTRSGHKMAPQNGMPLRTSPVPSACLFEGSVFDPEACVYFLDLT